MKHLAFFLTISWVYFFATHSISAQDIQESRGYISKVGDTVANLELNMLDSSTVFLHDLRGKVVVLQFTASWCSVCRKEMPHLEKEVWLPNKDKDFVLIAMDVDQEAEKVEPFIQNMDISYPVAYDTDKSHFFQFATKKAGVTRNIIIDKEGKIAFQTRLFDKNEFEEMKSVIASLLLK